eukprot:Sspe_Gene.34010::Locus_16546_Transcript_1_1_Confidence_1.000_Length_424::g.34010::m.34010
MPDKNLDDDITKKAAMKVGVDAEAASRLYWGGIEQEIANEEEPVEVVPETPPKEELLVVRKEDDWTMPPLAPEKQEFTIRLKEPLEPLGISIRGIFIVSVTPKSPAARAGVLP